MQAFLFAGPWIRFFGTEHRLARGSYEQFWFKGVESGEFDVPIRKFMIFFTIEKEGRGREDAFRRFYVLDV